MVGYGTVTLIVGVFKWQFHTRRVQTNWDAFSDALQDFALSQESNESDLVRMRKDLLDLCQTEITTNSLLLFKLSRSA